MHWHVIASDAITAAMRRPDHCGHDAGALGDEMPGSELKLGHQLLGIQGCKSGTYWLLRGSLKSALGT
jgi:hypothetical protein